MRLAAPKKGFRDNSALPRCRTTDQNRVSRIGSGIDESGIGRTARALAFAGQFARWMRFVVRALLARADLGAGHGRAIPRHQAGGGVFDRRVAHVPKCS
jgi:hypothetical protein